MMTHPCTLKWRVETITSSSKVTNIDKHVKLISLAPLIGVHYASVNAFIYSHRPRGQHAICYWWHAAFDIRVLIYSVQHDEHECSNNYSAGTTD